jgi:uncharacterized lipoprotein YajG
MRTFVIVLAVLLLSACSTTLPLNYIPSSSVRGDASVSTSSFRYIPSENREVAANQFQKNPSSIGQIYTGTDIAIFVHSALKKELAYSGFKLDGPDPFVISGDVTRFYYDWLGFTEVDFEVKIDFKVSKNGEQVFEYTAFSHQKAPKTMAQDPEAIRAALSSCIDDFLTQARAKSIL